MNRTARGLRPLLLPVAALLAVSLTACSGAGGDDNDAKSAGGSSSSRSMASGADSGLQLEAPDAGAPDAAADEGAKTDPAADLDLEPQVIRQGEVSLRSPDVARTRADVQKVVVRYAGQVTDEDTQTDDDGRAAFVQMVLRVPTDDFAEAMTALQRTGTVESAHSSSKDVTAQVVDVKTRVEAQRRSIARITVLFDRATDIKDVMAIESELAQRQADLDALESKQAYLASQTSLSTIQVTIDVVPPKHGTTKADDHGFLAGLSAGWGTLRAFAVGLATLAGVLLPWLVVVALVGIPTLLVVRSARRRTPAGAPEGQSSE